MSAKKMSTATPPEGLFITDPRTGQRHAIEDLETALADAIALKSLATQERGLAGLLTAQNAYWQSVYEQLRQLCAKREEQRRQDWARDAEFFYLGQYFRTYRQFAAGEDDAALRRLRSIGVSNYKGERFKVSNHLSDAWSHEEFYRLAAGTRMPEGDVFIMNNEMLVVPCSNELFGYISREPLGLPE
jgi:hypothetical protein